MENNIDEETGSEEQESDAMDFTDELKTGVENLINVYDTRTTFTDCEGVTQVGVYEVAHFFYQIPDGMVTTWDDVKEYFVKKYGSRIELRMSRKIQREVIS